MQASPAEAMVMVALYYLVFVCVCVYLGEVYSMLQRGCGVVPPHGVKVCRSAHRDIISSSWCWWCSKIHSCRAQTVAVTGLASCHWDHLLSTHCHW